MQKITFVLIVCLVFYGTLAYSQKKISGTVLDKSNHNPIGYVSLGITDLDVGTVSNQYGKFILEIPDKLLKNPITVSHLGYKPVTVLLNESANDSGQRIILLDPAPVLLEEISITASGKEEMGYLPDGTEVKGFFKAEGLGMEGGTLIYNHDSVQITDFSFNIISIPFDSLKFRLNFYSVKKSKPADKLNAADIIFTISKADTGTYKLSLEEKIIIVTKDYICAFELIELFGQSAKNATFMFSAIPDRKGMIFKRSVSMGRWSRIPGYSLCFRITGRK